MSSSVSLNLKVVDAKMTNVFRRALTFNTWLPQIRCIRYQSRHLFLSDDDTTEYAENMPSKAEVIDTHYDRGLFHSWLGILHLRTR